MLQDAEVGHVVTLYVHRQRLIQHVQDVALRLLGPLGRFSVRLLALQLVQRRQERARRVIVVPQSLSLRLCVRDILHHREERGAAGGDHLTRVTGVQLGEDVVGGDRGRDLSAEEVGVVHAVQQDDRLQHVGRVVLGLKTDR